jgi:tripartite-type tricarboxylate transporter receptor subunit TctC
MKRRAVLALAGLTLAVGATSAATQVSDKPIRLIVPTPAGGPSDTIARALAKPLAKVLGQPVVVENKPGAGGALAAQAVMVAPADGHTLLWGLASMATLPMLHKSPPYRSMAQLEPVSIVGSLAFGLFVHPRVPAATVREFLSHVGTHPDQLSYATGTLGEYMATTQLLRSADARAVRVPYRGGPQLMPDLLAGRVQFNIGPLSGGLPHVRDGKLRLLAVLLPQRSTMAPETPTLAETGVASVTLPTWQALFAPPGTPRAVVDRIAREVTAALREPTLKAQLEQQGLLVQADGPAELARVLASDIERWQAFIRDFNIPQE